MASSLASATRSRVDSASKHILPCKTNTEFLASNMQGTLDENMRKLQQNKNNYSTLQNDVCIGLGKPLYGTSINSTRKKAYPSVVATLGDMHRYVQKWIAIHNYLVQDYTQSVPLKTEFTSILKGYNADIDEKLVKLDRDQKAHVTSNIDNMLEFYFMGVALGLAYAHPSSGDTVCSVMVGGLRTVRNGHYQIHTGDMLMFYFDAEVPLFEENGGRHDRALLLNGDTGDITTDVDWTKVLNWMDHNGGLPHKKEILDGPIHTSKKQRRDYGEMENGNFAKGPNGPIMGKVHTFKIKPYIVSRHPDPLMSSAGTIVPQHFPCDKCRIFGRAISNSRPFDWVDIQLSRQST